MQLVEIVPLLVFVSICAVVAAGVLLLRSTPQNRRLAPAAVCVAALAVCLIALADFVLGAAGEPTSEAVKKPSAAKPAASPTRKLTAPKGWPEGLPLPRVASNCAACHLTAGRELTDAVKHFSRSVHDLNDMTCYDCHGGNKDNDVKAHEEDFGFIGTKISAHIKQCTDCHTGEAERLAAGPHHWDFSTRVNLKYPTCVDCHGNHDVGNPPEDFKLTNMCLDCHNKLEKEFPNIASVVKHNDQLADVLRKVRQKNIRQENPIPEKFHKDVAALRADTMQAVHASKEVPPERARGLNERAEKLGRGLEEWLKTSR